MAATVEILAAAERDLAAIADHLTAEAGERAALRQIRRIRDRTGQLAEFPYSGVEDALFGPGRRKLVVPPYIIVHRVVRDDLVRIVRVVHSSREPSNVFGGF